MPAKITKNILWLVLSEELCLITSSGITVREHFVYILGTTEEMTSAQNWPKTELSSSVLAPYI